MRMTSRVIWAAALATSSCSLVVMVPAPVVGAAPAQSPGTYVVVTGDTLWGISAKMKTTFQALLDANQLTPTSLILPGQRLVTPAGGVVPKAKGATTTSTTVASKSARTNTATTAAAPTAGPPPPPRRPPTSSSPATTSSASLAGSPCRSARC